MLFGQNKINKIFNNLPFSHDSTDDDSAGQRSNDGGKLQRRRRRFLREWDRSKCVLVRGSIGIGRRRGRQGVCFGGVSADGDNELLVFLTVARLSAGEVKGSVLGEVEERVAVVHVQDWIFGVAALEVGRCHLNH